MTKPHKYSSEETFEDRWGSRVASRGFFMKPVCLMRCCGELGLSAQEAVVLDSLFSYWFSYDDPSNVWVGIDKLAKDLSIGYSTVGRHLHSLEMSGFIQRELRSGKTNVYHLQGTIALVTEHVMRAHPPQKRGEYDSYPRGQPPP